MIRAEIRPARMNSAILEQEFLARQKGGQNGPPASPADSFPDLADLRRSASDVSESASLLGRMPPKPPTVRGSVGAILIRLIQRALFWYTPRLERFQLATANLASKQVGFLQEQARTIREQGNAIFKFEASLAQWESRERDLMNRVSELESDAAEMRSQWLIERKHRRELEDRLRSILHVFESLDLPSEEQERTRILGLIQPELNARLEKLHTLENLLKDVEAAGLDQHRELNNLRAQVQLRNRKTAASTDNELPLDSQWFDSFYLRFENTFRGTREDIRQRFSIYLPILRDSASVTQSAPLLDVGCGRGEWLELLQSEQVAAQGVDSNTAMIKECRQFGLPVVHADALTYLRTLPSNSFGALTCFHLLEHLAFPSLLRLLREFERVLQPNGLLILETPNISNARVALEEFYVDPTHRRPLPSRLLEFLVSSFEFREARVVPLHPTRHRIVPDENSMLAVWLRNQFEGPEDYAIVASRK